MELCGVVCKCVVTDLRSKRKDQGSTMMKLCLCFTSPEESRNGETSTSAKHHCGKNQWGDEEFNESDLSGHSACEWCIAKLKSEKANNWQLANKSIQVLLETPKPGPGLGERPVHRVPIIQGLHWPGTGMTWLCCGKLWTDHEIVWKTKTTQQRQFNLCWPCLKRNLLTGSTSSPLSRHTPSRASASPWTKNSSRTCHAQIRLIPEVAAPFFKSSLQTQGANMGNGNSFQTCFNLWNHSPTPLTSKLRNGFMEFEMSEVCRIRFITLSPKNCQKNMRKQQGNRITSNVFTGKTCSQIETFFSHSNDHGGRCHDATVTQWQIVCTSHGSQVLEVGTIRYLSDPFRSFHFSFSCQLKACSPE